MRWALLGRIFVPEEYQAVSSPVVVVGYQWWQRHFGGDPNLVGKKLMFNNQLTVVVGVMPPDFEYPPGREVWRPAEPWQDVHLGCGPFEIGPHGWASQQEMSAIGTRLAAQYPQTNAGTGVVVVPLRQFLFGEVRLGLLVLFGSEKRATPRLEKGGRTVQSEVERREEA